YGPNTAVECYQLNREHSFPNSWFGGEATRREPKYNDLFHMYPVSGRVNSIRNDNPYGKVQKGKATFTSSNGSTLGPSATPGFEGTVFEPIDEYKGDLARTYFYMVTRYEDEVADWDTVTNGKGEKSCVVCNGTSTQAMQDWAVAMFLEWHRLDPVSQKEIDRNDSIYTIQHNRNPFIDFPELVEKIWGDDTRAFGALVTSTEPEGYYEDAYGKSGYRLKTALHGIIKDHTEISYNGLWDAYKKTDARADGTVWDMYSDCEFTFGSNQCGTYKNECDCYNREHSFPKSWFNDGKPMYSDLFHLYPTDGYVNNRRGNNPFGEVKNPTYTSNNGGKLGPNATSGYAGTVFEPVDEYKGDFARSYFYMATCYEDKIADWSACPICSGNDTTSFVQWTVDLLLKWHRQDP
ncbi:MAG: endonuclease, partial [Bacteroidales bacterium]|nr:endonuclease [Bacteroidales bacterium]